MKRSNYVTVKQSRCKGKEICSGYMPEQMTPQEKREMEMNMEWYKEICEEYMHKSWEREFASDFDYNPPF